MSLLERADKFGATIQKLCIPRISNPKEIVNIEYADFGDTQAPNFEFHTTVFKIGNKEFRNDFYHNGLKGALYEEERFKSDVNFLDKYDLYLENMK